jgi:hypothetical protein
MSSTTTGNQDATHTNGSNGGNGTEGSASTTKIRATMSPVDAISKISKVLDQLSPNDRKRVLAFVSEPSDSQD